MKKHDKNVGKQLFFILRVKIQKSVWSALLKTYRGIFSLRRNSEINYCD